MNKELLSINEVATFLKVTEQYARKLIRDGKIKSQLVGKSWITEIRNLQEFVETNGFVIDPDDRVRQSTDIPDIVALSFFSGAMGLDIGMKNEGIKALLACEINKEARATIVDNNPEIGLVGDIWELNAAKIRKYANIPTNRQVDVIFGGPPCQAFSTAGARRGFGDSRGDVFNKYLDIVGELKPRYVIIENVRGILSTEAVLNNTNGQPVKGGALYHVINRLSEMGYTASFELYNTANFGSPQKRERVVIIAKRGRKKVPYLSPTHDIIGNYGLPQWVTLGEAILDLQGKNMEYLDIPQTRRNWFKKIPEGGNWRSLSEEEQKEAMGKKYNLGGGKTGFLRRLSFDEPSPTLVTSPIMPATDLIHPVELRALAVEEYARIQGFPDNWRFCGNILEKYRQIGNAVPVQFAEAIARTVIADMRGVKLPVYKGFKYSRYKNSNDVAFALQYQNSNEKITSKQISLPI